MIIAADATNVYADKVNYYFVFSDKSSPTRANQTVVLGLNSLATRRADFNNNAFVSRGAMSTDEKNEKKKMKKKIRFSRRPNTGNTAPEYRSDEQWRMQGIKPRWGMVLQRVQSI